MLVLLLLLNTLLPAAAQIPDDDDDDEAEVSVEDITMNAQAGDDDNEIGAPTEGVSGITIFPEFADSHFPAGAIVESLIGLSNRNDQALHVQYIRGMVRGLAPPYPFIQNFSGSIYNTTVLPGSEGCLLYRFSADPSIASQEYELLVELFYKNADNETYMAVVHNSTVFVDDAPTTFGIQLLFAYLLVFGMAGGSGYGIWRYMNRNTRRSSSRTRREESREAAPSESPAQKGAIDWDYVSPGHAQFLKGVQAPKRKESPARKESPNRKGRTSPTRKAE